MKKWAFFAVLFLCFTVLTIQGFTSAPGEQNLLLIAFLLLIWVSGLALCCYAAFSPNRPYLLLSAQGFTVRALFNEYGYGWSDIEEFTTKIVNGLTYVVFNLSPSAVYRHRETSGRNVTCGMLPDTYGMRAADLARLMNQWKAEGGAN